MMRIHAISLIAAAALAVTVAGCCDDDTPLGVPESGGGSPAVVVIGTTSTFAVLAADSINSTGATVITGDVGVSPGTVSTGFPPGTFSGTGQFGNAAAATAEADLLVAINDVTARSTNITDISGDLDGLTLAPGTYSTTAPISLSGTVTLNALGNPDAVFIIRTTSSLTVASGARVVLTGGAQPQNVFWLVGTNASIGSNAVVQGTIMADGTITMDTGSRVVGRVLSRNGAVMLNASTIVVP